MALVVSRFSQLVLVLGGLLFSAPPAAAQPYSFPTPSKDWDPVSLNHLRTVANGSFLNDPPNARTWFYPDPRVPDWTQVRANEQEAGSLATRGGVWPLPGDRFTEYFRQSYLQMQGVRAGGYTNQEYKHVPYLVGEVLRDVLTNPGISVQDLLQLSLRREAALFQQKHNTSQLTLAGQVPVFFAGAAISAMFPGATSAFALTLKGTAGALGGTGVEQFFKDGKLQPSFQSYLSTLEAFDDKYSQKSLLLAFHFAVYNKDAATVLDAIAKKYGLPAFSGLSEEARLAALRQQFPSYDIRDWSHRVDETVAHNAERDRPNKGDAASLKTDVSKGLTTAQAEASADAFMANLRALGPSETFNEQEWQVGLFAARGVSSSIQLLIGINDPKLAAGFGRIAGAGIGIAQTYFNYKVLTAAPGLSQSAMTWASVGMYASVASIGMSVLQSSQGEGQAEAMKALMEQIQALQKMVAALYEFTQDAFAHMDRKVQSLHNATMRGFELVHIAFRRNDYSFAVALGQISAALEAINELRLDIGTLAESEIDGRYAPATCLITARAQFETVAHRKNLFERCAESLFQQFHEPERSTYLVRGRSDINSTRPPSAQISDFLSHRDNVQWYRPSEVYPLDRERLPYYFTTLSTLAASLGNKAPVAIPRANPAHWMKQTDRLIQLVTPNIEIYRSSPSAQLAVVDAIEQGEQIANVLEYFKRGRRLDPVIDALLSTFSQAREGFFASVRDLEAAYFVSDIGSPSQFLHPGSTDKPKVSLHDVKFQMLPCEKPSKAWYPAKGLDLPSPVREAVPREILVAEAIGQGRIAVCYRASYTTERFSVAWAYNSPNARHFDVKAGIDVEIVVTFDAIGSGGKGVTYPVLRAAAKAADSHFRERVVTSKSCAKSFSWNAAAEPGSVALLGTPLTFGGGLLPIAACRGNPGPNSVTRLDTVLSTTPLEGESWTWEPLKVSPVPKAVASGIGAKSADMRKAFLQFLYLAINGLNSANNQSLSADTNLVVRSALADREAFAATAGRLFSRPNGVLDRLRAVEMSRSLLVAYLHQFLPRWEADRHLVDAIYGTNAGARLVDGPFFLTPPKEKERVRSLDDLERTQRATLAATRERLMALTSRYDDEKVLNQTDLTMLRERISLLKALSY